MKSLPIYIVSLPIYANLARLVFDLSFLPNLVFLLVGINLFMSEGPYLLLYNICFIVLFSFPLLGIIQVIRLHSIGQINYCWKFVFLAVIIYIVTCRWFLYRLTD